MEFFAEGVGSEGELFVSGNVSDKLQISGKVRELTQY